MHVLDSAVVRDDEMKCHAFRWIGKGHRETNFHHREFPCHLLTQTGMSKWDIGRSAAAVMDCSRLLLAVMYPVL